MKKRIPSDIEDSPGNSDNSEVTSNADPGIALTLVWLVSSSFDDRGFDSLLSGGSDFDPGEHVDIEPDATVWLGDSNVALVQLTVRVAPKKQPTFSAQVSYAAQYVVTATNPIVDLEEFAWGNGLANLVPFVRAHLAELTGESRYPTFYLQPLNLRALQLRKQGTGEYAKPQL